MTLNQVISRIKGLILAHKMVRNFYRGLPTDFLTDKTTRYPSSFLMDRPGSLELGAKIHTFNFTIFLLDLVHVSENTKANEQDVQSDMIGIIKDLVAEFNHSSFTDWRLSLSNQVTILAEQLDDMVAGASIDLSISVIFNPDVCAVPTDIPIINEDMKLVYDEKYVATGAEGSSITTGQVPVIAGKKILLITREFATLHKVSSSPDPAEFTWNGSVIGLGTPVNPGERFLILYRTF